MKQKIIGVISIFIMILIQFLPNTVLGASNDYTIEDYNIKMIVNEDNTFDITESITVNFNIEKHGIYRKIPLMNEVKRLDGTKSENRAKISDIEVNNTYTVSNKSKYKVIKIGDENKKVTGRQTYIIKYKYNIGKDPLKDADELYFNLIGNEWDTSIKKVEFTIKMPKNFDKTKLGFSRGYINSINSSNISYSVYDNIIVGYLDTTLLAGEGLTVRLALPEDYFIGESINFDNMMLFEIDTSIIFVIIAYVLWKKHGKDEMTIETVEFYPPNDLNSADIGFIYKGYCENKDVISLLIYLANKGYLKIEEYQENNLKLIESEKFKIIKVKEYDGDNLEEKKFFEKLFEVKNEVTIEELYNKFYITIDEITRKINRKENQEKIFEKISLGKRSIIITMIIIVSIFITDNILILVPLLVVLLDKTSNTRMKMLLSIMFVVSILFFKIIDIVSDYQYLITLILEVICFVLLIIFLGIIKKRTPYGREMLGKIQGFKNFLEMAEKPQLEQLVMENPEYFYNILPYAYVLGVSNKWMQKFESIALKAPTWYDGYSNFNVKEFNNLMNYTYSSISIAMSSSPSSSGGRSGGSSGGGSSGGGSGGGGRRFLVNK